MVSVTMNKFLSGVFDDTSGGQLFSPASSPSAPSSGIPFPEGPGGDLRCHSNPPHTGGLDLLPSPVVQARPRSSTLLTLRRFVSRVFDDTDEPSTPLAQTNGTTDSGTTEPQPDCEEESQAPAEEESVTLQAPLRSATMPPKQLNVAGRSLSLMDDDGRPRSRSTMTSMTEEGLKAMNQWAGDLFGESPGMTCSTIGSCNSSFSGSPHEVMELRRTVSDALAVVKAARLAKKKRQQAIIE
ncbi:hypothetical protein DIPPA_27076 [Diplonema papillatum]|nr:hypothetical protein DIPPA_27076 [Diplonema papillatum]|eukprot:gene2093-3202_t